MRNGRARHHKSCMCIQMYVRAACWQRHSFSGIWPVRWSSKRPLFDPLLYSSAQYNDSVLCNSVVLCSVLYALGTARFGAIFFRPARFGTIYLGTGRFSAIHTGTARFGAIYFGKYCSAQCTSAQQIRWYILRQVLFGAMYFCTARFGDIYLGKYW